MKTSGKKNKRRRLFLIFDILIVCFILLRLKTSHNNLTAEVQANNAVVFIIANLFFAVGFGFWWIMRIRRNSAKESIIYYDGTAIMYDCLHSRNIYFVYSEERRCYMIYECVGVKEANDKYTFYGDFAYVKKDNFGNVSTQQCKRVSIPKYFDNLDEIVKQFKQNKNL